MAFNLAIFKIARSPSGSPLLNGNPLDWKNPVDPYSLYQKDPDGPRERNTPGNKGSRPMGVGVGASDGGVEDGPESGIQENDTTRKQYDNWFKHDGQRESLEERGNAEITPGVAGDKTKFLMDDGSMPTIPQETPNGGRMSPLSQRMEIADPSSKKMDVGDQGNRLPGQGSIIYPAKKPRLRVQPFNRLRQSQTQDPLTLTWAHIKKGSV